MNEEQYKQLVEKVGVEAANKIKSEMQAYEERFKAMVNGVKEGTITTETFEKYKGDTQAAVDAVKEILAKQGTTMQEVLSKLNTGEVGSKSIAETLKSDAEELREIFKSGNRKKEYMLSVNAKGEWVMKPFDTTKAAGPHASVGNVGGAGNTASISQSIDATTLLRMGSGAPIQSLFRNTPWIFGVVNLVNVGFDNPFFFWFDEVAKQGSSATVAEGGAKPLVQYNYSLKSDTYKKEAMLIGFTEEFSLDFDRLQSDIMNKSQIDLINRINAAILPRIKTAATAFNIGATYSPVGDKVDTPNDWDVIAALSAQVEQSTFASQANTALMSTIKKYRIGTLKDTTKQWLNQPDVLANINIVSNPDIAAQDIIVGDLKQYNVALRGGIIVKVGYNGTDFANNMFSTVVEQYYYDYISAVRATAIVKGPDFATVKTALA